MLRANNFRLGAHQSVDYTVAAGTIATAFATGTWAVRVLATTAANIKIGVDPTAVAADDVYLPASRPEVFLVNPGEKLSAIRAAGSTDGTVHVTELT